MRLGMQGEFLVRIGGRRRGLRNQVTHEGVDHYSRLLGDDPLFSGATGPTMGAPLYVGLIKNQSFSGENRDDTMASHPGWLEATGYEEPNRQVVALASVVASPDPILLSNEMVFTASEDFDFRGLLMSDDLSKGGSSGKLWCTATTSAVGVVTGQLIRVTYRLTCSFLREP